jgi:hypothetical protein
MQEQALLPRRGERRRWGSSGLDPRFERTFHRLATLLVLVIGSAWAWSIWLTYSRTEEVAATGRAMETASPTVAKSVAAAIAQPTAASMAFLNEAAMAYLTPLRGRSGALRSVFQLPGETVLESDDPRVAVRVGEDTEYSRTATAPSEAGIYEMALQFDRLTRPLSDVSVITLVPFSEKRRGRIGSYMLGTWPYESGGMPRSPRYAVPRGFVKVTPETRDVYVSEHFRLGDFLTKGQADVWPKYVLLEPRLLDKLELVIQELEAGGVDVRHLTVMSGFRTPHYNESGGNTAGRANLSRHMYGDGADVFVDNDEDNWTDDITGDGRVTTADAEAIARAAERVEKKHPDLLGGIGIYPTCCGHGPFVHVDVRGYRARWRGTGTG